MPPHVVAGHLVAVLAPIAALLAIAYVARPGARRGLRWTNVVASVASAVGCFLAGTGGKKLYTQLTATVGEEAAKASAYGHAMNADLLTMLAIALAMLVVVGTLVWLAPGRRVGVLGWLFAITIVMCAAAMLWFTFVTIGDGMASVWSHHLSLKG